MGRMRAALVGLSCAAWLAGCPGKRPAGPRGGPQPGVGALAAVDLRQLEAEGAELPATPSVGRELTPGEVSALLARVPPLRALPGDTSDFALRERSAPPPRAPLAPAAFPPPPADAPPATATATAAAAPLTVVRYAPEGDLDVVPSVSVTFSQPMVELTALGELPPPPIRITPAVDGSWRWVGTQTALFTPRAPAPLGPDDPAPSARFPAATAYRVDVEAGTRSALGGRLPAALHFGFTTPPPKLLESSPSDGPRVLTPRMFAAFDQAIDPAAVLATISTSGQVPLRLLTRAEVDADPDLKSRVQAVEHETGGAPGPRWLAFAPAAPLPGGRKIVVSIGPGTPSAEGPRRTTAAQSFDFETFGPLRVTEVQCSYSDGNRCRPWGPIRLELSNPIPEKPGNQKLVTFSQPGLTAMVGGGRVIMTREKLRPRSTITMTISGDLTDEFGQQLGKPVRLSFSVAGEEPELRGAGEPLITLDPTGKPSLPVHVRNHAKLRVRLWAVEPTPDNLSAFNDIRYSVKNRPDAEVPGRLVSDRTLAVGGKPDTSVELPIDLGPALRGGVGQVIVLVDTPPGEPRQAVLHWVQVTQLAVDAVRDAGGVSALVSALADGAPLAGVEVTTLPNGATARSGADGVARFALRPRDDDKPKPTLLLARRASAGGGADVVMLTGYEWDASTDEPTLRWLLLDDRGTYRPGETAHIKGFVRGLETGKGGDLVGLTALGVKATEVEWQVNDARGARLGAGRAKLSPLGGFDFAVRIGAGAALGEARVRVAIPDPPDDLDAASWRHQFNIQEFRRPEFEVVARAAPGVHFLGDKLELTAAAAYYAGGGLPHAYVEWHVKQTETSYTPPGRGDFQFGRFEPWWIRDRYDDFYQRSDRGELTEGHTDVDGQHVLELDLPPPKQPLPVRVRAEAQVMDVNRQAITGSTTVLVHSGELYVGLRSERMFVDPGTAIAVEAIVSDLDGALVPGRPVTVTASRTEWVRADDGWTEREVDVQPCQLTSASAPSRCSFATRSGGLYYVRATVEDGAHRKSFTELSVWVSGAPGRPRRELAREVVTLIPDRREYAAGDVAHVLVQAPFYPAEGVAIIARSGVLETRRFSLRGPTHTIDVPIAEGHVPNLWLRVQIAGSQHRFDARGKPLSGVRRRPAYAAGELLLEVPPRARTLALTAKPRETVLAPGATTEVALELHDAAGRPVAGGEVTVVVVDEAVLALGKREPPDPLQTFYRERDQGVDVRSTRADVQVADVGDPDKTPAQEPGHPDGEMIDARAFASHSSKPTSVTVRADFDPLALFAPLVVTGADGRARVTVKLPDNLTRYRVLAIALAGQQQFGTAEAAITARRPLMVRPSPPRFLNFGDRFQLSVVVQNQTDAPLAADVAVRAANAQLIGPDGSARAAAGRRVEIPANDRVEMRFPAAAVLAGRARFQLLAIAGVHSDAALVDLPVWTPATSEAFATYGSLEGGDGAIAQPVRAPPAVFKQFGGLEVTTSSTQLGALTDAVLYLESYPYQCAEQMASRLLAVAALRDVLDAFRAAGMPSQAEIEAAAARDVKRLAEQQNGDGGWGFWDDRNQSWPMVSIHVTHALVRARDKQLPVPLEVLASAEEYLEHIEEHLPEHYGAGARREIVAYALYVRARMGHADVARARKLLAEVALEDHALETLGWLWPVLASQPAGTADLARVRRQVANRVVEEAGTAHWTTGTREQGYLVLESDRRVDGVLLEAVLGDADPAMADLVPKVVRGLLGHRVHGHWGSTQDNAWVLLALDRYFEKYEGVMPDFTARTWFGELEAEAYDFRGRTTEQSRLEVPMAFVARSAAPQTLVLAKRGPGRMYYRIGMRYAPLDLKPPAAEHGFTVLRSYVGADRPEDVRRDAGGVWHIRAGARVSVRVTMVAPARRYHVALVDPLPAGLEPLNPALSTDGEVPTGGGDRYWWWWRSWYEHQNLRDERAEAFTSLLWDGVHEYQYSARATTYGSFVVPPARAEEMYQPETFGRSAGDRVVVE